MILIVLAGGLLSLAPFVVRAIIAERRREKMASQFRAALQNIVHALRVGVGLSQALDYTAKESDQPMAGEWQRLVQALRLGTPMAEALEMFSARIAMKEAAWFCTAIQITQTSGGSLADVLETLSSTLQEQQTLREKVGALTAQGKASGILLAVLPYALMGAMAVVAPDIANPLFTTTAGQCVIVGVTVSIVIGGIIIKKIVTIEVN